MMEEYKKMVEIEWYQFTCDMCGSIFDSDVEFTPFEWAFIDGKHFCNSCTCPHKRMFFCIECDEDQKREKEIQKLVGGEVKEIGEDFIIVEQEGVEFIGGIQIDEEGIYGPTGLLIWKTVENSGKDETGRTGEIRKPGTGERMLRAKKSLMGEFFGHTPQLAILETLMAWNDEYINVVFITESSGTGLDETVQILDRFVEQEIVATKNGAYTVLRDMDIPRAIFDLDVLLIDQFVRETNKREEE